MVDMLKTITGKYFINAIAAGAGAQALMRGRVVGPLSELMPIYLCEIFPADETGIAITVQTVLPIEALVGMYLYDERPIFDAAWSQLQAVIAERRKQVERAKRAQRNSAKRLLRGLSGAVGAGRPGTQVITADSPEELAAVLEMVNAVDAAEAAAAELAEAPEASDE